MIATVAVLCFGPNGQKLELKAKITQRCKARQGIGLTCRSELKYI